MEALPLRCKVPSAWHRWWLACLLVTAVVFPLQAQGELLRDDPQQLGWEELSTSYRVFYQQKQYERAWVLAQEALRLAEQYFGPDHPYVAQTLNDLGYLCQQQGKIQQAEMLHQRALAIRENMTETFGVDKQAAVVQSLSNVAKLYQLQGRYADAEPLLRRVLDLLQQRTGPNHPSIAATLYYLAQGAQAQDHLEDAQTLLQQAVAILDRYPQARYPDSVQVLETYAAVLRKRNRFQEAQMIAKKAETLRSLRRLTED